MRNQCEIGSEFWCVPTGESENIFPNDTKWFISGRSALQAIIQENDFKTVWMPDWCCESMLRPFGDAGINIKFYPVIEGVEWENVSQEDAVFVMDYFGYASRMQERRKKGVIIRDVTHSLFSFRHDDANYYFGSLRKWAGFWTGGYAWGLKRDVQYRKAATDFVSLRKRAMEEKALYIKGEMKDKGYLSIFEKAEEELEEIGILPADKRDIELADKLNVKFIREQRRKNAQVLLDAFSEIAVFPKLEREDCPMFVPIRVKNRDALRKYLIQKEIYCPIHWPKSQYHRVSKETEEIYDEELSLVCDQRYTEGDMERLVASIKEFWMKGT